jgi:hypothetical protein
MSAEDAYTLMMSVVSNVIPKVKRTESEAATVAPYTM